MRINVHAGHNPDGKVACGAVGLIKESTEARKIKDAVISMLRQLGHTAYDCTCNDGKNSTNVLDRIIAACNSHAVDLDVSIHLNSGANNKAGDGKTTGVEVLIHSLSSKAKTYAEKVCAAIAELGFKNRGVKVRTDLRFLRKTKAPAMLIECCFVDDKDDVQLYDYQKMAEAIVYGITGQKVQAAAKPADQDAAAPGAETAASSAKLLYRVQVGAYSVKGNANLMLAKVRACGFEAFIVEASGLYRVQVGAYSVKSNAETMQAKLRAAGFDAIIVNA